MRGLLSFLGATLGGYVGWWLGERGGFFLAFVVSTIGTGAGIYYARKLLN